MDKSVIWVVAAIVGAYLILKKAGAFVTEAYNSPAVQARIAQQQVSSVVGSTSQALSDVASGISNIISAVRDIDWDGGTESATPATDISELINLGEWH